jgi:hypothetical protein
LINLLVHRWKVRIILELQVSNSVIIIGVLMMFALEESTIILELKMLLQQLLVNGAERTR